ncbi:hypothetical protein [Photorhabdus luminescens]
MNEVNTNQAIKHISYNGRLTGHSFRHTMSTIIHKQGYNTAWIESQLTSLIRTLSVVPQP